MKKKIYLLLLTLLPTFSWAQIEMNSLGNVAIGGGIPSSYDLSTGNFSANDAIFSTYLSSIKFENFTIGSYPAKRMVPTSNNVSTLGVYMKAYSTVFSYSFATMSDQRQKENIKPLAGSLDIIKSLNGVKYDLKKSVYDSEQGSQDSKFVAEVEKSRKNKIGFIAQNVYEFLPEAVLHDDSTDMYAVDYTKIVPVLVEAIKEQQSQIEELQKQIAGERTSNKSTEGGRESPVKVSSLMQNNPNPFNEKTEIRFNLTNEIADARLYIYDMQGRQVKSLSVNERGQSSVTIRSGELEAGMYLYTLIADGQEVGTKKMILTK